MEGSHLVGPWTGPLEWVPWRGFLGGTPVGVPWIGPPERSSGCSPLDGVQWSGSLEGFRWMVSPGGGTLNGSSGGFSGGGPMEVFPTGILQRGPLEVVPGGSLRLGRLEWVPWRGCKGVHRMGFSGGCPM